MSFALMSKPSVGVASRTTRARVSTVRVSAAVSAKNWISNWKTKQAESANRISWFPGTPLPEHLDGSLPGDFGFDPLSLGVEEYKLKWYVQAELQNGRWAMLAVAGILFQEALGTTGLGGPVSELPWWDNTHQYFAPTGTLFVVQMLLFNWVEVNRWRDMKKPGSVNVDPIFTKNSVTGSGVGYPGFDPLSLSKGDLKGLKVKEIKNARLAMLAFLGFAVQAYTTGKTPLAGLAAHLADPWATTVFSNDFARLQ